MDRPSGNLLQFAIKHGPFSSLIYLLKIVIFHSYVSLPEGSDIHGGNHSYTVVIITFVYFFKNHWVG